MGFYFIENLIYISVNQIINNDVKNLYIYLLIYLVILFFLSRKQ